MSTAIQVLLDMRLTDKVGIGRYGWNLTTELPRVAPDLKVSVLYAGPTVVPDGVRVIRRDIPYYSVQEQFRLPSLLRDVRPDILHSPHFLLPVLPSRTALISTIHDVAYLASDSDLTSRAARAYYRTMMSICAYRADQVITDSEFCRQEVHRYLRVPMPKIQVIHLAPASVFVPQTDQQIRTVTQRHGLADRPYFLYAGIIRARKNLSRVLQAFAQVRSSQPDLAFVIAGPSTEPERRSLVANLPESSITAISFLGKLKDDDLAGLMAGSLAFVYVSLYEGFGLPILEAMAVGTPVITSDRTSMPEIAGQAACLVSPTDVDAIAQALVTIARENALRQRLRDLGLARAQSFSWPRVARETADVYRRVAS